MPKTWQPSLGAWPVEQGIGFRVWAPEANSIDVVADEFHPAPFVFPLAKQADGTFAGQIANFHPGTRYRYRINQGSAFPDPASRFQPDGVHGSSEVVDPNRFVWSDRSWQGIGMEDLIIYELHVGAFTTEGTFTAIIERLSYLVGLGITAIELMPLGNFPGQRNWGYDGVNLFGPAGCYGRPDDLRQLVNEAHRLGLAVLLDVVYNHFGPDGNYLRQFSPFYFSEKHHTPWGDALNFDGPHSEMVRAFFLENALHWVHEYHFDGLRLDATHAIYDDGPKHFFAELTEKIRQSVPERRVLLIAEDERNLATIIRPASHGGWGFDGVWADDFHHQIRRCLAGDNEGYYRDFSGSAGDIATTLRQGWFYCGQQSHNRGEARGTDTEGIPSKQFVICIQNHDQVGNRAFGSRLNHEIDAAAYRAASALLLCAPQTPLLFMGQEWGASTAFQFFTDHHDELGRLVTVGRRNEFKAFAAFNDPRQRELIPDPQAESTFLDSKLNWAERQQESHACTGRLYRELLRRRRTESVFRSDRFDVSGTRNGAILLRRVGENNIAWLVVVALKPNIRVALPSDGANWQLLLTTEDAAFSPQPRPPLIDLNGAEPSIGFPVPAAVILSYKIRAET